MRVILISGKAEHGKDYVGNMIVKYLQSQGKRVMVMHFADMLKYCCKQYMGWDGNKDEAGRRILQQVGTDWRIGRNERIWADMTVMIAQHFSEQFDYCIVPDWRFIIEYNAFCESFGKKNVTTLRVTRYEDENYWQIYKNHLTPEQQLHASEVELDKFPFDYDIANYSKACYNNDSDKEYDIKTMFKLMGEKFYD